VGATLVILQNELLLRWRLRARVTAMFAFGATTLLLFSFAAGPQPQGLRDHAAGFLWVALLFASALSLSESFQVDMDNRALEGLLLLSAPATALYYGKALANALELIVLGAAFTPMMLVLYDAPLRDPVGLLGVIVLGAFGLAVPGTLYIAMTAQARSQQVLLPLLLFPLVVPVVIAAVKATSLLMGSDPMRQLSSWLVLLACFDAIYASLGGLMFGRIVED
jgi:heme exporter protein B